MSLAAEKRRKAKALQEAGVSQSVKLIARSTRGRRVSELKGEDAEADESFWGQDAWQEDDDSDFSTEEGTYCSRSCVDSSLRCNMQCVLASCLLFQRFVDPFIHGGTPLCGTSIGKSTAEDSVQLPAERSRNVRHKNVLTVPSFRDDTNSVLHPSWLDP